jgi:hypothetical protein
MAPYGFKDLINTNKNVKLPCNMPVQSQKVSRGIALLIPNLGARSGWAIDATPQALYYQCSCIGGWVGCRASLDE